MGRVWRFSLFIHVILLGSAVGSLAHGQATRSIGAAAQSTKTVIVEPVSSPTPSPSPSPTPRPNFIKDIVRDQKAIWLSPFRLKQKDLKWVAPFAAATAALILTDRETSSWVSRRGSLPGTSRNVSLGGSDYAAAGVAAGFYLVGRATGDHRAKETGRLAAEAFINTKIVVKVLKFA
ncbi:MAG TPA: hypothetical protein VNA17_09990, partial [Pyrinomonadaceae bacterium]|nr:hypothetical protein [Pyrinomonadaceae bacterium]